MSEALRLAQRLEILVTNEQDHQAAAAELRRLHAELERKSDAIQRLWKERDELRALNAELVEERDELRTENRVLVRQNGRWQEKMETTEALNAELVEALRKIASTDYRGNQSQEIAIARAALAKAEANNGS